VRNATAADGPDHRRLLFVLLQESESDVWVVETGGCRAPPSSSITAA
jgi:hypothetical protein